MATFTDVERRIRDFFREKKITLYGPHRPPSCLRRLESIRDELTERGYPTKLVKDWPDEDEEGNPLDPSSKSSYWIQKSHYNIFIHFVDGVRNGLAIEINDLLGQREYLSKSLVAIEMNENGEYLDTVTELLRESPLWKKVKTPRFQYEDDDVLLQHILTFLDQECH